MKRIALKNLLALLLVTGLVTDATAASRKSKEAKVEVQAATNSIANIPSMKYEAQSVDPSNPLAGAFKDPVFVKSFLGGYGVKADVEPKFDQSKTNEVSFYRELSNVMGQDVDKAAYMISTNLTADSNPIFDYTLGTILLQNGDNTNAISHLEKAIEKFPTFLRAWKNLGMANVRAGNYSDAIAPFTKAVELGGADGQLYGLLGYCYMNDERYLPAEAAYRNAVIFLPENKDWKMGLIKSLLGQSKFTEASSMVSEMLAKNPNDISLWSLQASIHSQQEDYTATAVDYEILRKFGKIDFRQLMVLGDIYMSQDAKDLALEVYLEGVDKEEPGKAERTVRAAMILASRGAFDEAEKLVSKVRSFHGDKLSADEDMKLLKVSSKISLARGETEVAVAVLEKIIERDPLDGEALLMVGDFHMKQSETAATDESKAMEIAKADYRFDLASRIEGFGADAAVKKAQLNVKQKKYTQAVDELRKAQKIKPRDSVQRYLEAVERMLRQSSGA